VAHFDLEILMDNKNNAGIETAAAPTSTNQQAIQLLLALWRSQDRVHFIGTLDKATGKFRNVVVKSPEEAVAFASAYSAAGLDTYLAVAEYLTPESRTANNAAGAWTFIVDIDVGSDKAATGKGYPNPEEAEAELETFCEKAGLEKPSIVVNSGTGLHAYWCFDTFLEKEQWLAYAAKFKALMKSAGFRADAARTADISSVLRVPETLNFKYTPPRPVTLLSFKEERIELTLMLDAIDAAMVTFGVKVETLEVNAAADAASMTPVTLQGGADREPPNLLTLASALKTLTPDCDEKTWKFHRLAPMAYESRYHPDLHDALYKLARDWSSGDLGGVPSVKWNTPASNGQSGKQCFDRVWKRFLTDSYTGKRASLGTIFWHAQQLGWVYTSEQCNEQFDDGKVDEL